jgi:hypothetical protein
MEVNVQLQDPAALTPEKEPLVLIGQEAWWAHSQSGRCGVEKTQLPGIELQFLGRPIRRPSLYQCRMTDE